MPVLENTREAAHLCLVPERDVREQTPLPSALVPYRRELEYVVDWAHAYLCEPHAELGRDGPVCPYARASLEQELFWLAVCADDDDVANVVRGYRRWFTMLPPFTGRGIEHKAIVILFPTLPPNRAGLILDPVQAALKTEFVEQGLMVSQFHSACSEVGRWNRSFYPLRCAVPLVTIRVMVRMDAPFLVAERDWLVAYLGYFGDEVPHRFRRLVLEAARRHGVAWN